MRERHKGQKSTEKKKTTTRYTHQDMLLEIFLCLPVKSLVRFKCISKSWFSHISDTSFAKSHFQLNAATHTRRIEFIKNDLQRTTSLDLEEPLDLMHAIEKQSPKYLHPEADFMYQIISSCKGFIFLYHSSSFRIWNPCTGVHKRIPLAPSEYVSNLKIFYLYYLYSFGYDQLRDDYLVVSLSYDPFLEHLHSRLEFFSMTDNRWNEIEGTQLSYVCTNNVPRVGSLFNGAIHWLVLSSYRFTAVVIAFDLTGRKLFEIAFPNGVSHKPDHCELWVCGEFLSLWATDCVNGRIEIWVMQEYKVGSSWIKAIVLPMDNMSPHEFSPICSTKNGDIIGTYEKAHLLRYNDVGQLLCTADSAFLRGSQSIMYTESLLSLPSDNMQAYEDDSD